MYEGVQVVMRNIQYLSEPDFNELAEQSNVKVAEGVAMRVVYSKFLEAEQFGYLRVVKERQR